MEYIYNYWKLSDEIDSFHFPMSAEHNLNIIIVFIILFETLKDIGFQESRH